MNQIPPAKPVNKTPEERAQLKTLESLAINCLTIGLPSAIVQVSIAVSNLVAGQPVNWLLIGVIFVSTLLGIFSSSFGHGVAKLIRAQGDAPLADAVDGFTDVFVAKLAQAIAVSFPGSVPSVPQPQGLPSPAQSVAPVDPSITQPRIVAVQPPQ